MEFQFSAGGIVYKKENGKAYILIGQHSGHKGWVFPKGLIGDKKEGEKKEETAMREVKEETGIEAEVKNPLTPITYLYVFEGVKIKKTVYYFVMKAKGGDISKHDWEMSQVKWVVKDKVEGILTYPSDKKVWSQAQKLI